MRKPTLLYAILAVLLFAAAPIAAQFHRRPAPPKWDWLPPEMGHPSKLSADRLNDDEYPAITRDAQGRTWVVWSSCRPKFTKPPVDKPYRRDWRWPDDGQDSIIARRYDGENWSNEYVVSSIPGVNHKPQVVADDDGIRVLWTARRDGRWFAYERRWSGNEWQPEQRIDGSGDTLTVRARALTDGSLLAVFQKMAPPRFELHARIFRDGEWQPAEQLDESQGRCYRPWLLAEPNGTWSVAWDEERGGNYDIHVRDSKGVADRITTSPLWDTAPTLARTRDGRLWIAWERREPYGGRYGYRGRSIFGKIRRGGRWQWAPSPFPKSDPGRLTRHSSYWAAHAMSEERYPQLLARGNGEVWLFWLGGGRMSSVSFSGRVLRDGKWSEPKLLFYNSTPYTSFQLPSVREGVDLRANGRGPYQTPLANQMVLSLDDTNGNLFMAYEVPKKRHITDLFWNRETVQRPAGFGADVYAHRVDLSEEAFRFPTVPDDLAPIEPLAPRTYRANEKVTLSDNGKEYTLVWGDMHGHTENDGIGTLDMYYSHGLFVTGMDFVASSNHDFTPDFLTQSEWAATQALSTVLNQIPERVALSGWEWTTGAQDERGGHRAMYFMDDNGPLYRSTTWGSDTVYKLYALLRGQDVILQPHHNNWTGYDEELQPVFEITSAWRQQREEAIEFKKEGYVTSVWEALDRGYRIGFVGSGDSHWMGTGEDYGITGAYVEDLTREGVFEAIRNKRVFASTGARMHIDFRVNGALMGDQIEAAGPVKIEVDVTGDADLDAVEIVKDHKVIHAAAGNGSKQAFTFIDQQHGSSGDKASYYYVRIRQKNEMYAWGSPTWVDWR